MVKVDSKSVVEAQKAKHPKKNGGELFASTKVMVGKMMEVSIQKLKQQNAHLNKYEEKLLACSKEQKSSCDDILKRYENNGASFNKCQKHLSQIKEAMKGIGLKIQQLKSKKLTEFLKMELEDTKSIMHKEIDKFH